MENKEKKMTKREYFEMLKGIVEGTDNENKGELIYFIDAQIASIDNKAEKAKERAEAKRAEGDALREAVKSVLTTEYQDADTITSQVEGEEITKAKVIARLTQLVKLGEATKADGKTEDGKTRKVYKLVD